MYKIVILLYNIFKSIKYFINYNFFKLGNLRNSFDNILFEKTSPSISLLYLLLIKVGNSFYRFNYIFFHFLCV